MTPDFREQFWRGRVSNAEMILRLNEMRRAFDAAARMRDRSCLGTAVGLEEDAVQLILAGFDNEARFYFERILDLSTIAFDQGETYMYRSDSEENYFAKYMAKRIAQLAEWVVGGRARDRLFRSMMTFLEKAMDSDGVGGGCVEPQAVARYAVHLCQSESWSKVVALSSRYPGLELARPPWGGLWKALLGIALAASDTIETSGERANQVLNSWFLKHTDCSRFNQEFDPRLTANDIVCVAEIRARRMYGEVDAWAVIRSIRWPDIGASHCCPR